MALSPLAGQPVPAHLLDNITDLISDYYERQPDITKPQQQVSFGTSGHRGSASNTTFNQQHIAAICQALVEHRQHQNITGPLFIGMDTHALSQPAHNTAIRVFSANGIKVIIQGNGRYTPTPVISNAIIEYNRGRNSALADGVIITPSHNPPSDGGFKYNPPNGGPADSDITNAVQDRANAIIADGSRAVKQLSLTQAMESGLVDTQDLVTPYVVGLEQVINMQAIKDAGLRIGVDPMGSAAVDFWRPIADYYGLDITVVNDQVDPQFGFMRVDKDGKIRMDCSSAYAMNGLIELKDQFDIAFANDPDVDRHGIVTPSSGLMNPNHYLAVAIEYLFTHRPEWSNNVCIGKTLVSSAMIDRVADAIDRTMIEVPVGFKWFVDGLCDGSVAFAGEESAGASFLRFDGTVWSSDKDGIILNLLAAEITAVTGKDPGQLYQALTEKFAAPVYRRIDAAATREQKQKFKQLTAESVNADTLAGETIVQKLTHAPGNKAAIGGLKITTNNGWFAARPSGTEDIYKIYAESFIGEDHLSRILSEAQAIVDQAIS